MWRLERRILETAGYQVLEARDGLEALPLVAHGTPVMSIHCPSSCL